MKIRCEFTIEVAPEDLPALRELAGEVETNSAAAEFIRAEGAYYMAGYLEDNGIPCTLTGNRGSGIG